MGSGIRNRGISTMGQELVGIGGGSLLRSLVPGEGEIVANKSKSSQNT
jgi:hypothetical protein